MAFPTKNQGGVPYEAIVRDIQAGNYKPLYFLEGEESYYIDRLADFIVQSALNPEERDFNLITLFGAETTIFNVIDAANGFPMGAQRLVVVVKEAQNIKEVERLEHYLKHPQLSTVLVFCYKNGMLDRRKRLASLIEKTGVLFVSPKLKDFQLPKFIEDYLRRKKVGIDPDATEMMAAHVGNDLSRMAGELDKLCIALPEGCKKVSKDLVAENIGISKDYNVYELQDALVSKNIFKAMQIANYFDKNSKVFPINRIIPTIFKFFQNLMLSYYSPDKSERGVAAFLGITEWQVRKNILPAMANYSGVKVMQIIGEIRRADARSKGVEGATISSGELLKELLFFILH